jgi:hypothetical protein
MNEAQWIASGNVRRMLDHVPYRVSKRKWRLMAAAFTRRIWALIPDEESRLAVEAAEAWADGLIRLRELNEARDAAQPYRLGRVGIGLQTAPGAAYAAAGASKSDTGRSAWLASEAVRLAGGSAEAETQHQCHIVRDILGYPYRQVTLHPAIFRWDGGMMQELARAAYDERVLPAGELDRSRLAILADALEEAGCSDPDVLGHLRGPGPHVRGCWAVDLMVGWG